jgi:hypothetical protein
MKKSKRILEWNKNLRKELTKAGIRISWRDGRRVQGSRTYWNKVRKKSINNNMLFVIKWVYRVSKVVFRKG